MCGKKWLPSLPSLMMIIIIITMVTMTAAFSKHLPYVNNWAKCFIHSTIKFLQPPNWVVPLIYKWGKLGLQWVYTVKLSRFLELESRRACIETTTDKLTLIYPPHHYAASIDWDGPRAKHGYVKELNTLSQHDAACICQLYLNPGLWNHNTMFFLLFFCVKHFSA